MNPRRIAPPLSALVLAGGLLASGGTPAGVSASTDYECQWPATADPLGGSFLGRYTVGGVPSGETAAEIVAYERNTLYVMAPSVIDVVDLADPSAPLKVGELPLPGDPTSVAADKGLVAVSVPGSPKTDPGSVLFFRDGVQVAEVEVGALPDMVTFTPDGKRLLVANEGEPNSYAQPDSVDPEGSVSIIDTTEFRKDPKPKGKPKKSKPTITLGFADFNVGGPRAAELPAGVRIFGPGATVAQDLEPEYITVAADGKTAWVSLQENNAIAVIDLKQPRIARIVEFGTSDHSLPGFGIDASDADGAINIANWPVKGLYMPDGLANVRIKGTDYVLTANEGDARDWQGIHTGRLLFGTSGNQAEEARRGRAGADGTVFPDATGPTNAQADAKLGRLNLTPFAPQNPTTGRLTELYSFGARSFSIRTGDGALVWDSGDDFECITASLYPATFNASNSNDNFDNRSDDKGPEPETITVGKIGKHTFAFVGLERIGGVMVYDISDPAAPVFHTHLMSRTFDGISRVDSGPEGMVFVDAKDSPLKKTPLLIYGNETTGTVSIWALHG